MKKLSLHLPLGYTFLFSVGWLLVMVISLEALVRYPAIPAQLPSQGFGSSHRQFEIQLDRLMDRNTTEKHIDCLVVGNSHVARGIDPAYIENAIREKTGEPFVCQNFGLMGTSVSLHEQIAEVLVEGFSPKLIIVGVSFADFDTEEGGQGNKNILASTWVQYHLERRITLDTLAINSLSSYRHYLGWYGAFFKPQKQLDSNGEPFEDTLPNGYLPSDRVYDFTETWTTEDIAQSVFFSSIPLVKMEASEVSAFEKLLSENSNVLVVETPFSPYLYQYSEEAVAKRAQFIKTVSQLSAKYHHPFIVSQNVVFIPDTGWIDFKHMNSEGAKYFSAWLSQKIITTSIARQIGE